MDPEFVAKFGAPADDQVLVLPLLLKEKVAALVYADAGVEGGRKAGRRRRRIAGAGDQRMARSCVAAQAGAERGVSRGAGREG